MFQKTKNHLAALIQLKKYNFFLFIFVLFIALFTLFDTTPKRLLLQQLNLTSSVPFLWLKSHPQLILAISSFFYFFQHSLLFLCVFLQKQILAIIFVSNTLLIFSYLFIIIFFSLPKYYITLDSLNMEFGN